MCLIVAVDVAILTLWSAIHPLIVVTENVHYTSVSGAVIDAVCNEGLSDSFEVSKQSKGREARLGLVIR